jgi:hypothetical protein
MVHGRLTVPVIAFAAPAALLGSLRNTLIVFGWALGSLSLIALLFSAASFGRREYKLTWWQVVALVCGVAVAAWVQFFIWSDTSSYGIVTHKAPVLAAVVALFILSRHLVSRRIRP